MHMYLSVREVKSVLQRQIQTTLKKMSKEPFTIREGSVTTKTGY